MHVIQAGRSLLFTERPGALPHLWFILTDPDGDPPEVVAVMVTTRRPHTDDTVILNPGDHPFIRHESCVGFSSAQRFRVSKIQAGLAAGWCRLREDMSEALEGRVRNGLLESPYTVHAIRDYCLQRFAT